MADIVTGTVTGQVDMGAVLRDIGTTRRELAIDTGVVGAHIKDSTDTVKDQGTAFYISGQQTNFANATALASLTAATNAQFTATQVAIELAQANNAAAVALANSATQALIASQGEQTRALMLSSKIEDLRFENLSLKHRRDRDEDGCGKTKFNFGPPIGAVVGVENS
jgi:hypothetical protein